MISGGKHTGVFSKHTTFQPNESMLEAYLDARSKFLLTQQLTDLAKGADGTFRPETDLYITTKTETSIPKTKAASNDSNAERIQTVTQSCVSIITDAGHGSGFLISANGKVMTA